MDGLEMVDQAAGTAAGPDQAELVLIALRGREN